MGLPLLMAAILVNISGLMLVVCMRLWEIMNLPISVHVIVTVIIHMYQSGYITDYYCESGLHIGQDQHPILYSNDLLWDGHQCRGLERPCCINPKIPWFIKTLNETTTQDIELSGYYRTLH